jgi:tripartite ATP-independent transporter DctP family solute receptor
MRVLFRLVFALSLAAVLGARAMAQPELGLAEVHHKGYPTEQAVVEFARLAHVYSHGALTIEVFSDGQITGNERTAIEMVQKGTIAFARVSAGALGAFNSKLNVFGLPYLFDSKQHLWRFLESAYGRKMLDELATSGLIGLCWYDAGARSFYARMPLKELADLQGARIRTHSNPLIMRMIEAMGGNPVPLGTSQIVEAFERGSIDAAENNAPSMLALGHYRFARHYLLNEHLRLPEVLIMSKAAWDRLPAAQRDAIRRAAEESVAFQREKWDAFEAEALATLLKNGVDVVAVEDREPFRRAVKKLVDGEAPRYVEALKAIEAVRPRR